MERQQQLLVIAMDVDMVQVAGIVADIVVVDIVVDIVAVVVDTGC